MTFCLIPFGLASVQRKNITILVFSQTLLFALNDRRFEVRKAAVKALVGIDHPDDNAALRRLANGGNPKLAQWAERVLALKLDVEAVLRELRTCQED